MLTKKHFTALAKMVKKYDDNGGSVGTFKLAHDLADICAKDNPRFDRALFLKACGVNAPDSKAWS